MSAGDTDPPFSLLLRRARQAAGLTQEELAERARLSWRTISDLERGVKQRPHRDTVILLADALAVGGADRAFFEAAARPPVHTVNSSRRGPVPAAGPPPVTALPRGRYLGAAPATRLVARDREWRHISAAVQGLAAGQGQVLLLAGEPGVGKTRLAQETMVYARAAGVLVLVGRCYEEHAVAPFFPFLEALAIAWDAASLAVRASVLQRHPDLAHLLPEALPPPIPGADARQRGRTRR